MALNNFGFEIKYKTKKELLENLGNHSFPLKYASDELFDDESIIMKFSKKYKIGIINPFQYASQRLKNDRKFALKILKINGLNFKYLGDNLKDDKELILLALKDNYFALRYVSKELLNDFNFMLECIKNSYNIKIMEYIGDELLSNNSFLEEAIIQNGFSNIPDNVVTKLKELNNYH